MKTNQNPHNKDKKTVMLFLPELHPVPDIKGGSVELMITHLLNENEKYNKLRFVVISLYDEDAEKIKFRNSKIYYYKDGWIVDNSIRRMKPFWIPCFFFMKIREKLFGSKHTDKSKRVNYSELERKLFQCLYMAKKEHAETLVFENFYYPDSYPKIIQYFGKHNTYLHVHYHREEVLSERLLVPNSISISKFVRDEWAKNKSVSGKNEVLYNCIDPQKYDISLTEAERNNRRASLGINSDDIAVVFCGRFIAQKGIKELLDAFDLLHNYHIKLILIGCYSYTLKNVTEYSKTVAARAESMDNVIYLGYVPNSIIQDYYSISDMMVIPSIWQEGAGLVTIEGMASGLPLIITNSGGMVEYVNDDCAVIVPIDNDLPQNLAKQIIRLAEDKPLRQKMGTAGKIQAKRFNPKTYYDNYVRIVSDNR